MLHQAGGGPDDAGVVAARLPVHRLILTAVSAGRID